MVLLSSDLRQVLRVRSLSLVPNDFHNKVPQLIALSSVCFDFTKFLLLPPSQVTSKVNSQHFHSCWGYCYCVLNLAGCRVVFAHRLGSPVVSSSTTSSSSTFMVNSLLLLLRGSTTSFVATRRLPPPPAAVARPEVIGLSAAPRASPKGTSLSFHAPTSLELHTLSPVSIKGDTC